MTTKIDASTQTEVKYYTLQEAEKKIVEKEKLRKIWEDYITETFLRFF